MLETLSGLYAGANWHERETFEMFGIEFEGHPNLVPLLLPDGFEGNPLRKEFVLASRVAKPWPGAKEPGESDHGPKTGAPSRRRMLPPGVPDPEAWGPRPPGSPDPDPLAPALAGAAPARPRRAAGERRARRGTRHRSWPASRRQCLLPSRDRRTASTPRACRPQTTPRTPPPRQPAYDFPRNRRQYAVAPGPPDAYANHPAASRPAGRRTPETYRYHRVGVQLPAWDTKWRPRTRNSLFPPPTRC